MLPPSVKYSTRRLVVLLSALTVFSIVGSAQKPVSPLPLPPSPDVRQTRFKKIPVKEGLEDYFYREEIKPRVIVNNLDSGVDQPAPLGRHTVKWVRGDDRSGSKIDIDGNVIALKGKMSLNHFHETAIDSSREVNFGNEWDEVRLYDTGERELIFVSMFNHPCTGTGCRVRFVLIYDLKTKISSFFGSYRDLTEAKLFRFGAFGTLDFLAPTYSELLPSASAEFSQKYVLYSMDSASGKFTIRKDPKGAPYFLKRVYGEDDYVELDKKFEMNWFEDIPFERVVIK